MIGRTLSHYKVLEKIGEGGMGEVYLAKDTKLDREVAIKVLPATFSENKERLARFEREARLLASLNHPNIAAIHGLEEFDGVHFLALELVPGETLAERIRSGPIPIDEALPLFKQIAEGLEAAHEKGVVHRDLKPANIKVTPEGKVKVLDFGLAKAWEKDSPTQGLSESPTLTKDFTEAGVLLGTAPYMSPEQARGKAVDKRTDIWAFGCCLYEALTGKTAFGGETISDTLAAVLKQEPDWRTLPATTPAPVRALVRRCLQKDSNRRLHDIADARIEIEETLNEPASLTVGKGADAKVGRRVIPPMLAAALAASIVTAVAFWIFAPPTAPVQKQVTRAVIPLSPGSELRGGETSPITISPDGKHVAYVARQGNVQQLYLKAIDELEGKPIDGTERALSPFFSPDSRWLGFKARFKLMKVALSGGAPQAVVEVGTDSIGACWTSEKEIVFNNGSEGGLSRISADGGEPETLTTPDHDQHEKTHRYPEPLPGGRAVLFTLGTGDIDSYDDASIAVLSLETGAYHVVIEGGFNARYSTTGHIVYTRAGSLLAAPFDLDELQVTGSPVPVLQGVYAREHSRFSISRNGTLLYVPGESWEGGDNRVVWVDREGRTQPLIETPGAFRDVRISPNGRFLALEFVAANSYISVYDIARATLTRLTFGFDSSTPFWTRDGHRLTFTSNRAKRGSIFWQAADGGGDAEQLTAAGKRHIGVDWSSDGRILALMEENLETGWDLFVLSLDGDRTPKPFVQTKFRETSGMFSPNGRWIAYRSDESGQNEIYIRRFPSAEVKKQVSTGGGRVPVWNRNGKELFYKNGDKMMVVDVETEGELTLGVPRLLFEKSRMGQYYDIAPDGQRFVTIERGESRPAPTQMILVQNWGEELKRLVPTN